MNKQINLIYQALKVVYRCLLILGEFIAVMHALVFVMALVGTF